MKNLIKKESRGFTLVELLVVMAIIAILVALIIYAINIARREQRNTQRRAIVDTAKSALESFHAKNKDYPDTPAGGEVSTLLRGGLADYAQNIPDSGVDDPSDDNNRMCYDKESPTQYWLYAVTEPTDAGNCQSGGVPADAEDFSVR